MIQQNDCAAGTCEHMKIITIPPVIHPSKLQRAQQYAAQVRERNPQMQIKKLLNQLEN